MEYFLNDLELSEEKNDKADAGNEWHDAKFYTTPETDRAFAKQVKDSKANYEIKMDNEYHQLMDGSEKTPGVCFVDDNMKRGDYSGFAYYVHEYPHEIIIPNLPTSKIAAGDKMTKTYWVMKDAKGNTYKLKKKDLEYRPGEGYAIDIADVDWLIEKSWMDNDDVVRADTHKDDIVNTFHLYAYTDNYSDPSGGEDGPPVQPENPDTPDDSDTPSDENGNDEGDKADGKDKSDRSTSTGDMAPIGILAALGLLAAGAGALALRRREN